MISKFIINEPKEINHFFSVSINVWDIKIRTINHLIYHLSHIMFPSSLIWDPLTQFLTDMYWIMHRIHLSIYRGICVNVITSSSMSDYSPSSTIFNLFLIKKFIPREGKNLFCSANLMVRCAISHIWFSLLTINYLYTYYSKINKWKGLH